VDENDATTARWHGIAGCCIGRKKTGICHRPDRVFLCNLGEQRLNQAGATQCRMSRNPTRRQIPQKTDFLHRLVFLLPLGTEKPLPRRIVDPTSGLREKEIIHSQTHLNTNYYRARLFPAFGNCNPLLNLLDL